MELEVSRKDTWSIMICRSESPRMKGSFLYGPRGLWVGGKGIQEQEPPRLLVGKVFLSNWVKFYL